MNRREFSNLLGGAAALWSQRAYAQQQSAPSSPIRRDWLDRRKEPILEPELPIIDPHHHLWQRPGWRYLLDDLLLDTGSGHNIVATVYMEASSMYRDRGPAEMRPVGEVEFANGVAAMCDSGVFGKTRVAAGIVGHADMMLGSRVEPVLSALMRAGGALALLLALSVAVPLTEGVTPLALKTWSAGHVATPELASVQA